MAHCSVSIWPNLARVAVGATNAGRTSSSKSGKWFGLDGDTRQQPLVAVHVERQRRLPLSLAQRTVSPGQVKASGLGAPDRVVLFLDELQPGQQ